MEFVWYWFSSSQLYYLKSMCYFKCNQTVFLYFCDLTFSKFVYISQNISQSWTCNRQLFVCIPWKSALQDTWWVWFRQYQQWCINFVFGRVNVLFLGYVWIYYSAVTSLKFLGAKMLNFRQITLFCLGYHLSKHKMTIYAKNLGGMAPRTTPGYAYDLSTRVRNVVSKHGCDAVSESSWRLFGWVGFLRSPVVGVRFFI